jgi:hypothetical protein
VAEASSDDKNEHPTQKKGRLLACELLTNEWNTIEDVK